VLSRTLEKIWNRISSEINGFFFERQLVKNIRLGFSMKRKIDTYLDSKKIEYISGVFPDSWDGLPKVRVKVLLLDATSFKECMSIWDQLCDVAYKGLSSEDTLKIYVSVDYKNKEENPNE